MIPGIGNAIMMADMTAELSGGYDALDAATATGTDTQKIATALPNAGTIPGTPTSMPVEPPKAPGGARRPGGYAAMGGGGAGLSANIGLQSLTPDGALTLKIRGFQDTMAQINKANREMAT